MIFDRHKLFFRVVDVFRISQTDVHRYNQDRHFGALSFRIRSDAAIEYRGKTIRMGDGMISYFPPDVDYWRTAGVDDMIVIHLDVPDYAAAEIESVTPAEPKKYEALFEEIWREWEKNRSDKYYAVSSLFYRLFDELYREFGSREDQQGRLVKLACGYMQEHFAESALSIPAVAAHCGISEVYLRRVFKEKLGVSPKEYLRNYRLRRAASLLSSGYYSVRKAAHACGYEDEKYFSVLFKKQTGTSPSRYLYSTADLF